MGHITSEKQAPSAIDYLGAMQHAVALERRAARSGVSKALKDVLARCIATYNQMCHSNKKQRIDTARKNLIMNLFLVHTQNEHASNEAAHRQACAGGDPQTL